VKTVIDRQASAVQTQLSLIYVYTVCTDSLDPQGFTFTGAPFPGQAGSVTL